MQFSPSKLFASLSATLLAGGVSVVSQERPNILWLTFEDTSAAEFACYGNKDVKTPNVDALAASGVQFMSAWSVGPQSSPARSSLITGSYASTYGMDVHPVPYPTPENIFFPQWLRDAGYYCTNNSKTHYNSTTDNTSCWDEYDAQASYNSAKRAAEQSFFAVFNTVTSHMGRVRTFHTDGRRDYRREGIYPHLLTLPAHVPDLPEVRSDYAGHLEAVQDVDTWVGFFLKDLKEKQLDENTIVFVFSDHGGCLPRGKGYLYESGLRVPLVIYFPEKWKHLANGMSGQDNTLISFVDLGPSVLSLAGVEPPKHLQGKALMGKYSVKEKPELQFAMAANQLHHYSPTRAVSDGRFKYFRSYIPYKQFAMRNYYQWGMPSNKAWDALVLGGHNIKPEWNQPFEHHTAEMLFDLENDPYELHNLADESCYAEDLLRMRKIMSAHIRETCDLGFFLPSSRNDKVLYNWVRNEKYPLDELYDLVEKAGLPTVDDIPYLQEKMQSEYKEMRFWAAVGFAQLALQNEQVHCPIVLEKLLNETDPYVRSEAAYAAAVSGKVDAGIKALVFPKTETDRKMGYSLLECLALDKRYKNDILAYLPELWDAAEKLPRKQNEDAGLMARGILVTLGKMDIQDLYGAESYEVGLKLNQARRPMIPLPN